MWLPEFLSGFAEVTPNVLPSNRGANIVRSRPRPFDRTLNVPFFLSHPSVVEKFFQAAITRHRKRFGPNDVLHVHCVISAKHQIMPAIST
jgi:hypothetical protein